MSFAFIAHLSLDVLDPSVAQEQRIAAVLDSTDLEDWFEAVYLAPYVAKASSSSPTSVETGFLGSHTLSEF